jgi:hypothetical protein
LLFPNEQIHITSLAYKNTSAVGQDNSRTAKHCQLNHECREMHLELALGLQILFGASYTNHIG